MALMIEASPDDPQFDLPTLHYQFATAATEVLDIDAPLNIPEAAMTTMRVKTGHFTLNISVNTRQRKHDRLIVTFHGARPYNTIKDPRKATAPMFVRRDWDEFYGCPILAISDPGSEKIWGLPGQPRVSMYFGTFKHDLGAEINKLIDKVAEELKVPLDNVILYGSSAGGTSALIIGGNRKSKANILVSCCFLSPRFYRDNMLKAFATAAEGTVDDWEAINESRPERVHPMIAAQKAIKAGRDYRCVITHNLQDTTLAKQFPKVTSKLQIEPDGGVDPSGRIMIALFNADSGHGPEPNELAWPLFQTALTHFYGPLQVNEALLNAKSGGRRREAEAVGGGDDF